ncbi:MAG: hypothetical protein HOD92_20560 [Deltaproteobacteria bacterium]|jgi:hypothetical protein|nr:hypothetical protein [Deltaproteobacteria bacterium]MBT4526250.1 hypothetical protein [Deltaproteobacteria bacterium]
MKFIRKFLKIFLFLIVILLLALSWIKIRSLPFESEKPLKVKWEGLFKDTNYRDVGQSINQCFGEKIIKPGLLLRSNGWFSGWSCDQVGNPDVIFSLNYSPEKSENYFCWDSDRNKPMVGVFANPEIQLHDIEFLKTWQNEKMRQASCRFFSQILEELIDHQKTLIHCNAGRDRTGAYSAILAAISAEQNGRLDKKMLEAIECDYRKTRSLVPDKFGRMQSFIEGIRETSTVAGFISQQCQISPIIIQKAAASLSY